MTPEQQLVYLNSQIACAQIEVASMNTENTERMLKGQSLAWTADDFLKVIDKYGISHNAVLTMFEGS